MNETKKSKKEKEKDLLAHYLMDFLNKKGLSIKHTTFETFQLSKKKQDLEENIYVYKEAVTIGYSEGLSSIYKEFFNHLYNDKHIDKQTLISFMKSTMPKWNHLKYLSKESIVNIIEDFHIIGQPNILDQLIQKNSALRTAGFSMQMMHELSNMISNDENKINFLNYIFLTQDFTTDVNLQVEAYKIFEQIQLPEKNELLNCFSLIKINQKDKNPVTLVLENSFCELIIEEYYIINKHIEQKHEFKLNSDSFRSILQQAIQYLNDNEETTLINLSLSKTSGLSTLIFKGSKENIESIPKFFETLFNKIIQEYNSKYTFQFKPNFQELRDASKKIYFASLIENKISSTNKTEKIFKI